jgi:hypothetical protein
VEFCDVVDKFLDEHRLAHTSTTEETNLATLCDRRNKVDNLDSRL